jgi:hypothetical protein
MREISASSWFYYKEFCYDARSRESKKMFPKYFVTLQYNTEVSLPEFQKDLLFLPAGYKSKLRCRLSSKLLVSTRLHGVIRQNTIIFIATHYLENLRSFASHVHFVKL